VYVEAALLENSSNNFLIEGGCEKLLRTLQIEFLMNWASFDFINLWDVSNNSFEYFCKSLVRFISICLKIYPNILLFQYIDRCLRVSQESLDNNATILNTNIIKSVVIKNNSSVTNHTWNILPPLEKGLLENCFKKLISIGSLLVKTDHSCLVVWEWHGSKYWNPYPPSVNQRIEMAYRKGQKEFDLIWQPGMPNIFAKNGYKLCFGEKQQVNKESGGKRQIRRAVKFDPKLFHWSCCLNVTRSIVESLAYQNNDFQNLKDQLKSLED